MYSTDNSPIVTNGGPLLSRVALTTSNRSTPVLQLPVSNPNSPRVQQRKLLYPDLENTTKPRIVYVVLITLIIMDIAQTIFNRLVCIYCLSVLNEFHFYINY